ncbi:MAG: hypothetical protein WCR54_04670 [Clostridia bacterium]
MKKKVLLTIITILVIAIASSLLVGCTENYKTNGITTNFSDKIESNGGMAVVYGEYLYFINGNAGNTDIDNVYGVPVKGAISRIVLKNGVPDGDSQIIVPKIVYGTDTVYGGIYIVNDYIYYTSPNSSRDGNGDQKSTEMDIMRTKVDGTDTQKIASFEDFSVVFSVENNNLMYVRDNELHSINLASKKFEDSKVEEDTILTNYKIVDGYIIYCMYNNEDTEDYILKAYSWSGGDPMVLANSANIRAQGTDTNYTISLIDATSNDDSFTAYFTLKDNELNSPEEGICSFTFDKANPVFDKSKMIRYTNNPSDTENLGYTQFEMLNNYVLAMSDTILRVYNKDGSFLTTNVDGETEQVPINIDFGGTAMSRGIEVSDSTVTYSYEKDSVIYSIVLFTIAQDGTYTYVEKNVKKIFGGTADVTYCSSEIIGNVVYYMNSGVSNNAYYFVIPEDIDTDTDYTDVKLLGEVNKTDFIASLTKAS